MFSKLLTKLFGSRNDRTLRKLNKKVEQINALEGEIKALTDEQLANKTEQFKQQLADGASADDILVEAFAVVREASSRVYQMRHFDVQLIGGMVLNENQIAEMRTGEGKTLTATLSAYLHALSGKGVHVITVNDYLASRDAEQNRALFEFLGLTVGVNVHGLSHEQKKAAYAADITYGTNNEFGFDYLRDNMAFTAEERVQRPLNYALVDEVDSILIDEARTPLIISGAAEDSSENYIRINAIVPKLIRQDKEDTEEEQGEGDFHVDEKSKQVNLTERGQEKVEKLMTETGLLKEGDSLYSAANISLLHHVSAALRAHNLFERDVDYIVQDDQIVIVDEHTGRTMEGRRWSEGLHQAVEAKEGVRIQNENQTLASITYQNYFRMYTHLAGMTGTADTEAFEFQHIYSLDTVVIPTNKPMIRNDMADLVYLSAAEKYQAIIEDIKDCQKRGQPALVGTISIEMSELLSSLLKKEKIKHNVLNAKFHEKEAEIITDAGKPGAVTIATNMAGRGTDIKLGGNLDAMLESAKDQSQASLDKIKQQWQEDHKAVLAAGGLHIIGTERHESRRIDNQLRGRSGRQGDPGSSRFYLSMEDSLMRIFASENVTNMMRRLGMEEGEAIEHRWVTRAIENAQRKVEARNFDIRKQLLEYDDVANDQRTIIYQQRDELMEGNDIKETIDNIAFDVLDSTISEYIPPQSIDEMWDITGLESRLKQDFLLDLPIQQWLDNEDDLHEESLRDRIIKAWFDAYSAKEQQVGLEVIRHFEKAIMLRTLDNLWKEHLSAMDHLRQGIHLRGYAQKNPKQEYKRESFELFQGLLDNLKSEVISIISKVQVQSQAEVDEMEARRQAEEEERARLYKAAQEQAEAQAQQGPVVREGLKVGRNDPCPCGSGKKFKQCHGKLK